MIILDFLNVSVIDNPMCGDHIPKAQNNGLWSPDRICSWNLHEPFVSGDRDTDFQLLFSLSY